MSAVNGEIVIHLNAIANNWRTLKARFNGRDVGAVVKANAYGLGESEVVETLLDAGCRTFFVSNLSEAISVRNIAPNASIVVFSGCAVGEEADFEQYAIHPVLVSLSMLARWASFDFKKRPNAYIKIDTGMGRYGLSLSDFDVALTRYNFNRLRVTTLMSHFAQSEHPKAAINVRQVAAFSRCYARFKACVDHAQASLCNSSAIFHFDTAHYDVARPGYALYGGNPTPYQANPMQAVIEVRLPVIQLRTLRVGDSVGYGASFIAEKRMRVATVYGGYADGILRSGATGLSLYWRGVALPVLGRVSMDSIVLDITHLPSNDALKEGDFVTFLGAQNTLDGVALQCHTIGYELLTSLSSRFKRTYICAH